MNSFVKPLKKGDLIAIVSPAKAIEKEHVDFAQTFFENAGFKVVLGKHVIGRSGYFSGTDEERINDFQWALDNPDVKAIICARGGYGAIRILDKIQWASQLRSPKWIVGFSDITVFHQRMQRFGIKSLHASMPLNFQSNTSESLDTLLSAITGEEYKIEFPSDQKNKTGEAEGTLVGGNLSILYSLLGTDDQIDYSECILFIEDVGEQLYALDRMLFGFKKAKILDKIKGLIVGGMTDMKDTNPSSGLSIESIILQHFNYSKTPVCFNFPAGHLEDNRALILGSKIKLEVSNAIVRLDYID